LKRKRKQDGSDRQTTLDGSCLHVWNPLPAQRIAEPDREMCERCGQVQIVRSGAKWQGRVWEKRPWHEW